MINVFITGISNTIARVLAGWVSGKIINLILMEF